MLDLFHQYGSDLMVAAGGDAALATAEIAGQQRVLRRLLTNPGDYLWNPVYGAGIGQFVGQPLQVDRIRSVIRGQIFQEAAVARTPEPAIDIASDPTGIIAVSIRYVDATTAATQALSFTVGAR